ncbi:DUF4856 domain-containing protein [Pedobacter gandavensis]|uniref:DUF4856 domain-containing protein n=1 Tax=Pedobacter gandavensis TaxID=2679963 RepID=UPI002930E165|nr:DUF4856 domain-containing protein [Pedobacter gandavensis]
MKNNYFKSAVFVALAVAGLTSCKKDKVADEEVIAPYDVPKTYNFAGANYASSTIRVKQMLELDVYMKTANAGTALDGTKATNLFNNTGNAFTDAALNTSGLNLAAKTTDPTVFKGYLDNLIADSKVNAVATNGTSGYIIRGSAKIIVGPTGVENGQAVTKGMMGSLFFKQALDLLASTKTDGTIALQQQHWDEAFGYLAVPNDYDPTVTYASTLVFPAKPALWGGYLAERGQNITAGKIIFDAFLKGRAAIGAKDVKVRDAQIVIIQEIWEKLAANAAYNYVVSPTLTANAGNLGSQFHALSEGLGFVESLKYRAAGSKLTDANFVKLQAILKTNFYTLINEAGFTKLKEAQAILKDSYALPALN